MSAALLVTFHSVGGALHARLLLAERGGKGVVVPVPRAVSSSCGYALETSSLPADALAALLDAAGIEWDAVYRAAGDGDANRYETIRGREA